MHVYVSVCSLESGAQESKEEESDFLQLELQVGSELSNVGAGNLTQVLDESSMVS